MEEQFSLFDNISVIKGSEQDGMEADDFCSKKKGGEGVKKTIKNEAGLRYQIRKETEKYL